MDQPLDDSPESVLLESLLEGLAEYYSKNLAREVMKGMKENAYQARFNGGWNIQQMYLHNKIILGKPIYKQGGIFGVKYL